MNYHFDLEKVGRNLFPFYLAIIFIAPIPFGSNRPWAWTLLAIISCTLLFIYLLNYARKNVRPPETTFDIKLIFVLLFTWLLYQIMQLVPLPVEMISQFSPKSLELKQIVHLDVGQKWLPLSLDVSTGLHAIYKSVFYVSFFVLTVCLVQSRDRLRMVILTVVFMGVIQSVWGMSIAFMDEKLILVSEPQNILNVVKGTFVNRNHFGGFVNLAIAGVIALLFASGLKEKRSIHRDKLAHHWQSRMLDWRIYLVSYLAIMLVALMLSESRGAIFSSGIMLILMLICMLYTKVSIKDIYFNYKLPIWLVGFIIIFSGADILTSRFSEMTSDMDIRIAHWENSLRIIEDFSIFGVGAGGFQHIYPLYDSGVDKHRLLHAHNDYLELLVEQGVVGVSIFALVVLIALKNAFLAIRRFSSLQQSAFAIASIMAIGGFLVHCTMEFNFQIPSNALYFFVFLAIALLQGMESIHAESRDTVWDEKAFEGPMEASISK